MTLPGQRIFRGWWDPVAVVAEAIDVCFGLYVVIVLIVPVRFTPVPSSLMVATPIDDPSVALTSSEVF